MRLFFSILRNVVLWLIVYAVVISPAFFTNNVVVSAIVFGLVFTAIFVILAYFSRMQEKNRQKGIINVQGNPIISLFKRILGCIVLVIAVAFPSLVKIGEAYNVAATGATIGVLVSLAIGAVAVMLITRGEKQQKFLPQLLGYLLLIIISWGPALFVYSVAATTDIGEQLHYLGKVYFTFTGVFMIAWWGFSLLRGYKPEDDFLPHVGK